MIFNVYFVFLLYKIQKKLGYTEEERKNGFGNMFAQGSANVSMDNTAAAPAAAAAEPVKAKEFFDLKLGAVSATAKIKIIKEVRTITGLGLKEAKELVEKAPVVVKTGLKKEEADGFMKLIVDAGGVVELL